MLYVFFYSIENNQFPVKAFVESPRFSCYAGMKCSLTSKINLKFSLRLLQLYVLWAENGRYLYMHAQLSSTPMYKLFNIHNYSFIQTSKSMAEKHLYNDVSLF